MCFPCFRYFLKCRQLNICCSYNSFINSILEYNFFSNLHHNISTLYRNSDSCGVMSLRSQWKLQGFKIRTEFRSDPVDSSKENLVDDESQEDEEEAGGGGQVGGAVAQVSCTVAKTLFFAGTTYDVNHFLALLHVCSLCAPHGSDLLIPPVVFADILTFLAIRGFPSISNPLVAFES